MRQIQEPCSLKQLDLTQTSLGKAIQDGIVLDEELEQNLGFNRWQDFIRDREIAIIL